MTSCQPLIDNRYLLSPSIAPALQRSAGCLAGSPSLPFLPIYNFLAVSYSSFQFSIQHSCFVMIVQLRGNGSVWNERKIMVINYSPLALPGSGQLLPIIPLSATLLSLAPNVVPWFSQLAKQRQHQLGWKIQPGGAQRNYQPTTVTSTITTGTDMYICSCTCMTINAFLWLPYLSETEACFAFF